MCIRKRRKGDRSHFRVNLPMVSAVRASKPSASGISSTRFTLRKVRPSLIDGSNSAALWFERGWPTIRARFGDYSMSAAATKLTDKAMKLTAAEKADLAACLLASLNHKILDE